jgi:hypothetical protein
LCTQGNIVVRFLTPKKKKKIAFDVFNAKELMQKL